MFTIKPFYFFVGLFIGFLIMYCLQSKPKVIIREPTLENAGKITYVDDNGVYYKYQKEEIK